MIKVPSLTVLCHPDPKRVGERVVLTDLTSGKEAKLARNELSFAPVQRGILRGLGDPFISRRPIRLKAAADGGGVVLDASDTGTSVLVGGEFLTKSRELSAQELDRGVVLLLARRVALFLRRTEQMAPITFDCGLVGESTAMVRLRERILQVADLDYGVLLRGETGTGKELVARAIHENSPRRAKPFKAINMGAIPPGLTSAELFGTTKGAFSGAENREGYFQRAHGGTLFLDEIGEASPEVQIALLRVLETGHVERVGARTSQKVDVRVIAATDMDLEEAIRNSRFREPLLHRLSETTLFLPALRERLEDLGRLFFYFLHRELSSTGEAERLRSSGDRPWVPAEIVARLASYDWPGNVRELQNVVRQLTVGSRGKDEMEWTPEVERLLKAREARPRSDIPRESVPPIVSAGKAKKDYRHPQDVGEDELLEALRDTGWNVTRAAERLNVARTTLNKLMDASPRVRKAKELGQEEIEAAMDRSPGNLEATAAALEVSLRGLVLRMRELGLR